jgi:hypothetical protein
VFARAPKLTSTVPSAPISTRTHEREKRWRSPAQIDRRPVAQERETGPRTVGCDRSTTSSTAVTNIVAEGIEMDRRHSK